MRVQTWFVGVLLWAAGWSGGIQAAPSRPQPATEDAAVPTAAPIPEEAPARTDLAPPPDAAAPEAPSPPTAVRLLILDLAHQGGESGILEALESGLVGEVMQRHAGQVVSARQLRQEIASAAEASASASEAGARCRGAACMVDLAKRVEADWVVGGEAVQTRDALVVSLVWLRARDGARLGDIERKIPIDEALARFAGRSLASLLLFGTPLDGDVPVLVQASELGAEVRIDEQPRGQTPLRTALAPGPHRIAIDAPGFVSFRTTLVVEPGMTTALHATLEPERLSLWPAALASLGASALAGGGSVLLGALAVDSYSGLTEASKADAYLFLSPADAQQLAAARQRTEQYATASTVLAAVAATFAAVAVGLETADLISSAE